MYHCTFHVTGFLFTVEVSVFWMVGWLPAMWYVIVLCLLYFYLAHELHHYIYAYVCSVRQHVCVDYELAEQQLATDKKPAGQ